MRMEDSDLHAIPVGLLNVAMVRIHWSLHCQRDVQGCMTMTLKQNVPLEDIDEISLIPDLQVKTL